MKHLHLLIAAIALLAFGTLTASAQLNSEQYAPATLTLTNSVAGASTINPLTVIQTARFQNVAFQVSFNSTTNENGNVTIIFKRSLDGTTYETNNFASFVTAANGGFTVGNVTNLNTGAAGFLRIHSIQNACTNAITNLTIKAVAKPLAR